MRRSVTENPQAAAARLELALKLHSLGLYEEALQHYLFLEKGGMESPLLYSRLAQVLTVLKRPREAAVYYARLLELNPGDIVALNELGIICQERKEYRRAVDLFQQAMAADPAYPLAPYNLALTYLRMGDRQSAMRAFRSIENRFPAYQDRVRPFIQQLQKFGIS